VVRFPTVVRALPLLQSIQIGSGIHPVSCSMGNEERGLFPQEYVRVVKGIYVTTLNISTAFAPFPHIPSWRAHGQIYLKYLRCFYSQSPISYS